MSSPSYSPNPHLGDILEASKYVKDVLVSEWEINNLANMLSSKDLKAPDWRLPIFPESIENFVEFIGVVNSVNFCFVHADSGKRFDVEYDGKVWEGAFGLAAAFKRALDEGIPVCDPHFLFSLELGQLAHILRPKTTLIPLFVERLKHLKNVGRALLEMQTSFSRFLLVHKFSLFPTYYGGGIINSLPSLDSYRDTVFWKAGDKVHVLRFNKRAYLFAMVYHGRISSAGFKSVNIVDPGNFLPITDYRIPQVLRSFGVLIYSKELAEMVDGRVVLKRNSDMEIGIRVQTVNAMTKLLKATNELFPESKQITMVELDYALWSLGRTLKSEHHLTMTTAY